MIRMSELWEQNFKLSSGLFPASHIGFIAGRVEHADIAVETEVNCFWLAVFIEVGAPLAINKYDLPVAVVCVVGDRV
jgi:hypothetical protein